MTDDKCELALVAQQPCVLVGPVKPQPKLIERICKLLNDAFGGDAQWVAVFRNPDHKRKCLELLFRVRARILLAGGSSFLILVPGWQADHVEALADEEILGHVALAAPGSRSAWSMFWAAVSAGLLRLPFVFGIGALARFVKLMRSKHNTNASNLGAQDYWTLEAFVVDEKHRGKGVGSAAMKQALAVVDKTGRRCVLKTQSLRNVELYSKFGFTTVAQEDMHLSGVKVATDYLMLRPATSSPSP